MRSADSRSRRWAGVDLRPGCDASFAMSAGRHSRRASVAGMPIQWASPPCSPWHRDPHLGGSNRRMAVPRLTSRTMTAGPGCGARDPPRSDALLGAPDHSSWRRIAGCMAFRRASSDLRLRLPAGCLVLGAWCLGGSSSSAARRAGPGQAGRAKSWATARSRAAAPASGPAAGPHLQTFSISTRTARPTIAATFITPTATRITISSPAAAQAVTTVMGTDAKLAEPAHVVHEQRERGAAVRQQRRRQRRSR